MWWDPTDLLLMLLVAHAMDLLYPYHSGLLLRVHPVHTSYVMAVRMGRPYSSKARGAVVWLLVVFLHLLAYYAIVSLSLRAHRVVYVVVSAYVLKTSFSARLLLDIVKRVAVCLESGDLECARLWVQQIVRRDARSLDGPHIASAAIESLAESLLDGYVSPLFYFLLFGPLGALFQRLTNTLDSALGYKEPGYRDVGWFSARADTVVNYVPARLTGILIALASPAAGGGTAEAIRTMLREHWRTESVNAGYPMSAIAGALGVRLEKAGHYTINGDARWPDGRDVLRAHRVVATAMLSWLLAVALSIAWLTPRCPF